MTTIDDAIKAAIDAALDDLWANDHCAVCGVELEDENGYGYKTEPGRWLCRACVDRQLVDLLKLGESLGMYRVEFLTGEDGRPAVRFTPTEHTKTASKWFAGAGGAS